MEGDGSSSSLKALLEIIADLEFVVEEGKKFSDDDLSKLNDCIQMNIDDPNLLNELEKSRLDKLIALAEL